MSAYENPWRDRPDDEPRRTKYRAGVALMSTMQRHLTEFADGTNSDPDLKTNDE